MSKESELRQVHTRDAAQPHGPQGSVVAVTLGALGVVYGDIGTSPLYAVNEICFGSATSTAARTCWAPSRW